MRHEALAREKYPVDFPTTDEREHTERVNELLEKLHSPEEGPIFVLA